MKYIFFCLVLFSSQLYADVTLPRIFGNNMVLQRDKPIQIWGWANAGENISVQLGNQTKSVKAGKNGEWKLSLNSMSAGGPHQLIVKGSNVITLSNILIGDVWICSGQSNMEWTVKSSKNPAEEIAAANYPSIRHFEVANTIASTPQKDVPYAEWKICSPENVANFTAVGYYFARELTTELNVPIGLINTTWGGTHVETWISREAFQGSDEFRPMIASMGKLNIDSLSRAKAETITKRIQQLQGPLLDVSSATKVKELTYDDSGWRKMSLPGLWEYRELGDFDGSVWFRKTIELPPSAAGRGAILQLGMIDDSDDTYVNGVKVGSTIQRYNEVREYIVASDILKAGRNVIAVRVDDTGGGGGIYGTKDQMMIICGDQSTISLAGEWSYKVESLSNNLQTIGPNSYPTLLFNSMISPLLPMSIKGAIWYQGESNAGRAYQYQKSFPLMIKDWRTQWKQGDFPFYFVQLSSYNSNNGSTKNGSTWAELREAQDLASRLPNTGMAVTIDIGEPNDIHPKNKQDVGKRLARIALAKTYGKKVVHQSPKFKMITIDAAQIIIEFATEGKLMTTDPEGRVKGFEIAGDDEVFRTADAQIVDAKTVLVSHPEIKAPMYVYYGWADDASVCNLFNDAGLPAAPFRTGNIKGITEKAKFEIPR